MEKALIKEKGLQALGVVVDAIEHDYNNLLTVIMGNLDLAESYLEPGNKVQEFLKNAEKASIRARELTQKLITFSKEAL